MPAAWWRPPPQWSMVQNIAERCSTNSKPPCSCASHRTSTPGWPDQWPSAGCAPWETSWDRGRDAQRSRRTKCVPWAREPKGGAGDRGTRCWCERLVAVLWPRPSLSSATAPQWFANCTAPCRTDIRTGSPRCSTDPPWHRTDACVQSPGPCRGASPSAADWFRPASGAEQTCKIQQMVNIKGYI